MKLAALRRAASRALGVTSLCPILALGQTAFLDFNATGQYTSNFAPWNDSGNDSNAGDYSYEENTTDGVGGSGGVDVFQSTDMTATYQTSSWDLSTNAANIFVSFLIYTDGQGEGNKVQVGVLNTFNNGLNSNPGINFESYRFIPISATSWPIYEQYCINGTTTSSSELGIVTVQSGHWYKFVVGMTNVSAGLAELNSGCALYDYGANGLTPGPNLITFSTAASHAGMALATNAAVYPAIRAFQNGGVSAFDNFFAYTAGSPPVFTLSLTNIETALNSTASFVALADGPGTITYQWQANAGAGLTNVPNATNATLTLANVQNSQAGTYQIIATSSVLGLTATNSATLTVAAPGAPYFTQQPTPASATNYIGGIVTFTAGVSGTAPVYLQWQHNGVNVPSATSSALSLASLQSNEAGTYVLVASNAVGATNSSPAVLTLLPPPNPSALNVLTSRNDNARDGLNANEVLLTLSNVNVSTFGRVLSYPVDGYIYTQPLYVSGLSVPGLGTVNAVFVATENNTVYAFNADSASGPNGGLLWSTNLGIAALCNTKEFGTRYNGGTYTDIVPEVGITGTPVINLATGTLYLDERTRVATATATNYYHWVHALNITNGTEESYSPVQVRAAVSGKGVDNVGGIVQFNALQENQRPGLTLANGMVFVGYGSFADTDPYHGWVLGFNATNLALTSSYMFNATPNATTANFGANAGEGALWMGGNGLCVDSNNSLFFATGNGSFSANTNGGDYGESFLRMTTSNALAVADYFTPDNQSSLSSEDSDLGSGGVLLLPNSVGSATHSNLMVGAGKDGVIRLVDRGNMGHYNANNDNALVQEVSGKMQGVWSSPAYFNNEIYYQPTGDVMKAFYISNATITATPVSESSTSFSALGGTPSISANGSNNGIAWTIQSDAFASSGPAVLHAYNAANLSQELYNSGMNLARDNPGGAIKMTTPTIMNGKVFVPAEYTLSIYGNGLFLDTPVISPNGGTYTTSISVSITDASPNTAIYYTLDGSPPTTNSLPYNGPFELTTNAEVQAIAAEPGAVNSGVAGAAFLNGSAQGNGTGLLGTYWANTTATEFITTGFDETPTLVRVDPDINFNWDSVDPSTNVGPDTYVVQWTGSIQPQFNGTYTFTTDSDDGCMLFVNGQELVSDWQDQAPTEYSGSIHLKAQERYNLTMDYYQDGGGAVAQLFWSSPVVTNEIVPQSQLYPVTNPPPSVAITAPATNATYTAAASISISADADAPYNPISYVSFYTNGILLGTVSNSPYALTVTGVPAGSYNLTAVVADGSGLLGTSAPVAITVTAGTGVPYGLTSNAPLAAFLNHTVPGAYTGPLPALLSETGAYSDTPNRVPSPGLIPYIPNTPLFSDNAVKSRYLGLPYTGGLVSPADQIGFAPAGSWTFPSGTVFVKNFDLVVNTTNTNVPNLRLETRLLVRDTNGAVYGVTYKWRPDNSDADLLSSSFTEAIQVTNAGGVYTQNWYFPSPADCLTCHTAVAGYVLGVSTRQLNNADTYPATGVTDNELRTLNRLGVFDPAFNEDEISGFEQMAGVTNASAPLVQRARSYLDANCAQCHQPGGTGITFDARYDTPLTNQNLINAVAAFSLGYDNAKIIAPNDIWRSVLYDRMDTVTSTIKMPPLARNLIDSNAVAVMAAWIDSLGGPPTLPPPSINPPGGTFTGYVSVTASDDATNATSLYYTLDGSLPTTNSLLYSEPILVTNSLTLTVNAWAPGYTDSVAATAQFTILPGIYFIGDGEFLDGAYQMTVSGPADSTYILQVSTNLLQWYNLSTNMPGSSPFTLTDPRAPGESRFYRVVQVP